MKIAICDDDKAFLGQLREHILQYAADNLLDYTVLEFERGGLLLDAVRRDPDIRILFPDIYMTPLSGMNLAELLRRKGIPAPSSLSRSVPTIMRAATRWTPSIIS